MINLKEGDKAPLFSAKTESGEIVSNSSIKGKKTILFFYPKDDTPGCTNAACSIRDHYGVFKKEGFLIYGVSPDGEQKHQKFINKYSFPYSLISDPEKVMLKAFGYWGPKKFMGKEYEGVLRTTVVINEEGIIQNIIDKVKTKEHGEQLIELLGL